MADVYGRSPRQQVFTARPDQRDRTSTSSRSPGGSRPTTSARGPEYKLEGTPLAVKGIALHHRRHAPIGRGARREDRRGHLDRTACAKGKRAAVVAAPALGPRRVVLDRRQGRRPRHLRDDGLPARRDSNAKTGAPITTFGKDGIVDLKVGAVIGKGEQIDLETGEIGVHSTPTRRQGRGDHRLGDARRRYGADAQQHQGSRARVRRADRQEALARSTPFRGPASSATTRGKTNSWADQRQRRRVDADHRRRGARPRLPAGRDADLRLLRRPSPRQQPVRREPGLRSI